MKKFVAALLLIFVSSYIGFEIGKSRGMDQGVKVASAVAIAGVQVNESQNMATLMGIARLKGVEEMYRWGESWLLRNNNSYIENKENLESILANIPDEEVRDTMEALIVPPDLRSVENYINTYVNNDKVDGGAKPKQSN
ncbi:hypothetical protein [Microbulbifer halophilus]|uniref:DUF3015 domain-containing protein n=1 Tax=Microbulbifer halophilus TaxID=453963 RepID=A0ABW5EG39_9GAMM|nr:hypothetical protein [Microbulbifer halophilus]MCW8128732.1 hypothetical protein [Microbulbifer halophilus]